MSNLAVKQATYQDIIDLPGNIVGEIINGQQETHPRPEPKQALAAGSIAGELVWPFQKGKGGPGDWWILPEPVCHLGSHILDSDLAGWCKQSMPALPKTAWIEITPDWVCEILSPSSYRIDRIVKMPVYAERDVSTLWLSDPHTQTQEAYQLHDRHRLLTRSFADVQAVSIAPSPNIVFHFLTYGNKSINHEE